MLDHYIRVKIFTERGRVSQGRVDIPYLRDTKIEAITARTIKPDGTVVELTPDAVFDRTIVKAGGLTLNAKSFALPGVEPGAIVEYRWREKRSEQSAHYVRLQLQCDVPVRSVTYHIKPAKMLGVGMCVAAFHCKPSVVTDEKDGFFRTSLSNVPAFHEAPNMPPEDQTRP